MAKKKKYFEFIFDVLNEKGKLVDSKAVQSELEKEADAINDVRAKLEKELNPDHTLQFKGFKKL